MATPMKTIVDSIMLTYNDWKLQNLKKLNIEAYESLMEGFVLKGVPKFKKCLQSLEYDKEKHEFVSDLTDQEIDILADWGSILLFEREIQNVTQFNNVLQNKEFQMYSQAQNLKEKKDYMIYLQEKVSQDTTDYLLASGSWMDNFKL